MANNNKKVVAPLIAIAVICIFIGLVAPLINHSSVRKHVKVDKWYKDNTETFICDGDELISSLDNFYNATGVQPYVLIVSDEDRVPAFKAYNRNFPDDEHILIYITECHPGNTSWDSESGTTYAMYILSGTYYDVEVYAGDDSLTSTKLHVLEDNLEDMDLTYGPLNANQSELIAAIDKTASEIGESTGLDVLDIIITIIALIVPLAPMLFFILFIVLIVKFANKRNANSPKPTSAPYPTPTVVPNPVPVSINQTTVVKPVTIEKPVFKPAPAPVASPVATPVQAEPVETKPAFEPLVSKPVTGQPAPVSYEAPVKTDSSEPIEITPLDPLEAITPIEPIKIEAVNFDLDANNILDNLGEANYDIPKVINTDFDDWGNI